ncbi:MAG: hypothetical protein A2521_08115 [Deltaproteobacteria bacterium RIFOXYD12_FULL_57_12]|nr:MAG: hypothetical protein A2521_08115 [Deltaproteobacteria bacterium RIFOXYD12_FULL_57_12]
MAPKQVKGSCTLCGKECTRQGMTKHLEKCLHDRTGKTKAEAAPCFHLLVTARNSSAYWLHLMVAASASLKALDGFLRQTWLECCGHMSAFRSNRREVGMSRKLAATLEPGMVLDYEYDFGDTTALQIKVLGQYAAPVAPRKPVEILARNQNPHVPCDVCGKAAAVWICPTCQWEEQGWLCRACKETHSCGDEEYLLPVVNSPRAGVCGYTG